MGAILAAPPTRRKPAKLAGMQPQALITTDLVLLGAGHAHVEVLRRFAMRREPGVRLTLIGREPETPYTGMLPGLIRGEYTFDQAHIDLAPLAAGAGARLILAEATAIDLAERHVVVTGRPVVPFDLLSIDVGGELKDGVRRGVEDQRAAAQVLGTELLDRGEAVRRAVADQLVSSRLAQPRQHVRRKALRIGG